MYICSELRKQWLTLTKKAAALVQEVGANEGLGELLVCRCLCVCVIHSGNNIVIILYCLCVLCILYIMYYTIMAYHSY